MSLLSPRGFVGPSGIDQRSRGRRRRAGYSRHSRLVQELAGLARPAATASSQPGRGRNELCFAPLRQEGRRRGAKVVVAAVSEELPRLASAGKGAGRPPQEGGAAGGADGAAEAEGGPQGSGGRPPGRALGHGQPGRPVTSSAPRSIPVSKRPSVFRASFLPSLSLSPSIRSWPS
ncbi:hypothetical protein ZWY2020_037009 [Hordeum vulgare]|nr:hypothetical protein ZWY2020_037009 [Hordeum vulgare]